MIAATNINLKVPFNEKDQAKSLGRGGMRRLSFGMCRRAWMQCRLKSGCHLHRI